MKLIHPKQVNKKSRWKIHSFLFFTPHPITHWNILIGDTWTADKYEVLLNFTCPKHLRGGIGYEFIKCGYNNAWSVDIYRGTSKVHLGQPTRTHSRVKGPRTSLFMSNDNLYDPQTSIEIIFKVISGIESVFRNTVRKRKW